MRDANANASSNNFIEGYTTTATAAGTTTLTVGSTYTQNFTGSTTQNCKLPVASTLVLNQSWQIINSSTGVVTIQSSGSNTVKAMAANSVCIVTCILASGTNAASWSYSYIPTFRAARGHGRWHRPHVTDRWPHSVLIFNDRVGR